MRIQMGYIICVAAILITIGYFHISRDKYCETLIENMFNTTMD